MEVAEGVGVGGGSCPRVRLRGVKLSIALQVVLPALSAHAHLQQGAAAEEVVWEVQSGAGQSTTRADASVHNITQKLLRSPPAVVLHWTCVKKKTLKKKKTQTTTVQDTSSLRLQEPAATGYREQDNALNMRGTHPKHLPCEWQAGGGSGQRARLQWTSSPDSSPRYICLFCKIEFPKWGTS